MAAFCTGLNGEVAIERASKRDGGQFLHEYVRLSTKILYDKKTAEELNKTGHETMSS